MLIIAILVRNGNVLTQRTKTPAAVKCGVEFDT